MLIINYYITILSAILIVAVNCLDQQSTLLIKGVTNFFWDYVNSNQLHSINVSSDCRSSLNQFNQDLQEGREWPLISKFH